MIKCVACKKEFKPKRPDNIFCSLKCIKKSQSKKCLNCGKIFKLHGFSRMCSKKCKEEHWLKRYPPRDFKSCSYCSIEKKYTEFRKVKPLSKGPDKGKYIGWRTNNDGDYRFSTCKKCESIKMETRYTNNPFPQMRSNAKIRAKAEGRIFDISTEYIKSIFPKDGKCPVLDVKFDLGYKKGATNKYAPSLDKIIPEKGYVEGNVVIVRIIVNRLKSDANYNDMEKVLKYYLNNKKFSKTFYSTKEK